MRLTLRLLRARYLDWFLSDATCPYASCLMVRIGDGWVFVFVELGRPWRQWRRTIRWIWV